MEATTEVVARQTELAKRYHNSWEVLEAEGHSPDEIGALMYRMHDAETFQAVMDDNKRALNAAKEYIHDSSARTRESLDDLNQSVQRYVADVDYVQETVNKLEIEANRELEFYTELNARLAEFSKRIMQMTEEELRTLDIPAIKDTLRQLMTC
ncbi:hypothetical protein FA95DRAFT_1610490 [Auriscalpium vulgare]|uniref:Uncharacterized protein n=1 Tax=Auriscalpium vulgare TaxID=40419 RepID=A0ACB8RDM2_9AGAM|nr:hypothetical protein FA95DRAFT_1610490 [Auriscalpium vulgare]